MIGASVLVTPFVLYCHRIGRRVGGLFVTLYLGYVYFALLG
jgi:hypothetical protein